MVVTTADMAAPPPPPPHHDDKRRQPPHHQHDNDDQYQRHDGDGAITPVASPAPACRRRPDAVFLLLFPVLCIGLAQATPLVIGHFTAVLTSGGSERKT